jgi:undecaprenyl diphosphate synthase
MEAPEKLLKKIDLNKLPQHIAIIMDGNGRWAKEKGLPRTKGHLEGANSAREIVKTSAKLKIKALTLYAFSLENWQRPRQEIDTLMSILARYLKNEKNDLISNNIKLKAFGCLKLLPTNLQAEIKKVENATQENTGLYLNIALSYSGRWEIVEATRKIVKDLQKKIIKFKDLNESLFSRYLCTAEIGDPDLLIRTSGEMRISNFLLYQLAYTEIYITPIYWPDFKTAQFYQAIIEYQKRKRRFGKI